jgi:hypothetical protein
MPEKSDKEWEWKSSVVAETLREAFEGLPETEMEALFGVFIMVRGIRREFRYLARLLREIRDELRKIRNEI